MPAFSLLLTALLVLPPSSVQAHGDHPASAASGGEEPGTPLSISAPGKDTRPVPKGAPLFDSAAQLEYYKQNILQEDNPYVAGEYLRDSQFQAWLKQIDLEKQLELFSAASRLKDLSDMLYAHKDAYTLRRAFVTREGFELCENPKKLLDWIGKFAKYVDKHVVDETVWEWNALSKQKRNWIKSQGVAEEEWRELRFTERNEKLAQWGNGIFDALMAANPKSEKEIAALEKMWGEVAGTLDKARSYKLYDRIERARTGVHSLAEAQEKLKKFKDPRLLALLQKAQDAGSMEEMLTKLSEIYDGLGIANHAVRIAKPETAEQTFSDEDRIVLQDMLKTAFMREIKGTTAGGKLEDFYSKASLQIRVADIGANRGEYHPDTKDLWFSEKSILEYLKAGNHTVASLKTEEVFNPLAFELLEVFVHEATHQRQDAWAEKEGIPSWGGQHVEIEAMTTGALLY